MQSEVTVIILGWKPPVYIMFALPYFFMQSKRAINWQEIRAIKKMPNDLQVYHGSKAFTLGNAGHDLLGKQTVVYTIRQYSEQIKRFNNLLHRLRILPVQNKEAIKSREKRKVQFEKEIRLLEEKLVALLR